MKASIPTRKSNGDFTVCSVSCMLCVDQDEMQSYHWSVPNGLTNNNQNLRFFQTRGLNTIWSRIVRSPHLQLSCLPKSGFLCRGRSHVGCSYYSIHELHFWLLTLNFTVFLLLNPRTAPGFEVRLHNREWIRLGNSLNPRLIKKYVLIPAGNS